MGLEKTPEEYIEKMVQIFREVRRVLRPDGTLWLNLGDSYIGGGRAGKGEYKNEHINMGKHQHMSTYTDPSPIPKNLKPKDLCGIPWRVALALQADGWYLRSDIIWHKPNPMPESVQDRPTKAHEYLFLLTKNAKYYYDNEAIKEKSDGNSGFAKQRKRGQPTFAKTKDIRFYKDANSGSGYGNHIDDGKRNKRSIWTIEDHNRLIKWLSETHPEIADEYFNVSPDVWTIPTRPFSGAHFAVFPPDLIEPCILAGTSEKGCCAKCGASWERIVEKTDPDRRSVKSDYPHKQTLATSKYAHGIDSPISKTTGWEPSCKCDAGTRPCIVLDPFGGAMTTAMVAYKHGREFTMIELSKTYIDDIGIPRIEKETRQIKMF